MNLINYYQVDAYCKTEGINNQSFTHGNTPVKPNEMTSRLKKLAHNMGTLLVKISERGAGTVSNAGKKRKVFS